MPIILSVTPEGLNINNGGCNPLLKMINKETMYKSAPDSESVRNGINCANEAK